MGISHQASLFNRLSQPPYAGIRFVLIGFEDPDIRDRISRVLVLGGAVDAGRYSEGFGYSEDCTHVIVHNIEYDHPVCVTARQDGKVLVSWLWVEHCFDATGPMSTDSVIYVPPRNLKGIPGAESIVVCLTGYQQDYRKYIRAMVQLMGAEFALPNSKVTHLICYKFEGQRYEAAKKIKSIKLVNHKWLEDCLRKWEILREEDYSKSGHDLEAEALLKQEVSRSQLNSSPCRLFSNAEKDYRETSLVTKVDDSGTGVAVNVMQGPVLKNSVICVRPRDLKGIPGAESLVVCLTGYRGNDKKNIMVMLQSMGAGFTENLKTDTVTHLLCYRFEGQKYEAAKKLERIKLVNHKWLEDCLRRWEILPEYYLKSGHDLKMEAEALLKQEVSRSLLNTSACRLFSNAENVVSATIKSSCDLQKSSTPNMENNDGGAVTNFKSVKRKSLGKKFLVRSVTLDKRKTARLDDENGRFKWKMEVSNGCPKLRRISLDDDISIRESSYVESGQELRKNPQADSVAKSPGKITPSKTIVRNSSEGLKGNC